MPRDKSKGALYIANTGKDQGKRSIDAHMCKFDSGQL
ncbi:50S ribosomal protein L28 [Pseudoalteromonas tunicata D2]|uniref:50S ribosomal protein L28 n=1 Tax=Pseudoalteromonas tunicata D2 TaxID=87626 RepID=A4C8X6_9GAMM|nr:50S ribosomal protein L28 [Pseudoalteromonas tunicata D2]